MSAVTLMQLFAAAWGNTNPEVRRVKIDVVDDSTTTIDRSLLFASSLIS